MRMVSKKFTIMIWPGEIQTIDKKINQLIDKKINQIKSGVEPFETK